LQVLDDEITFVNDRVVKCTLMAGVMQYFREEYAGGFSLEHTAGTATPPTPVTPPATAVGAPGAPSPGAATPPAAGPAPGATVTPAPGATAPPTIVPAPGAPGVPGPAPLNAEPYRLRICGTLGKNPTAPEGQWDPLCDAVEAAEGQRRDADDTLTDQRGWREAKKKCQQTLFDPEKERMVSDVY
jgi:3-oxoacyl-[acyl-carrier protein] reductase